MNTAKLMRRWVAILLGSIGVAFSFTHAQTTGELSLSPGDGDNQSHYCINRYDIIADTDGVDVSALNVRLFIDEVSTFEWVALSIADSLPWGRTFTQAATGVANNGPRSGDAFLWFNLSSLSQTLNGVATIAHLDMVNQNLVTTWSVEFYMVANDDGIDSNISYISWNDTLDILAIVQDATYNFTLWEWHCIDDTDNPTITDVSWLYTGGGSVANINGQTQIGDDSLLEVTIYDWGGASSDSLGNSAFHYRFDPAVSVLANYVPAPGSVDYVWAIDELVDNNVGINSGTIAISVVWASGGTFTTVSHPSSFAITTRWGITDSINADTFQRLDRWYDIDITLPAWYTYPVEQEINLFITGSDNTGNTQTASATFNSPINPTVTFVDEGWDGHAASPVAGDNTNLPPLSSQTKVKFTVADDRAWVDTWSVTVSITQTSGAVSFTWDWIIFSWSDFTITSNGWSAWLGNWWGYIFLMNVLPYDFNESSEYLVQATGVDLAGNISSTTITFTTRPSCATLGCSDAVFLSWITNPLSFNNTGLVITWSEFPYLTRDPTNGVVECSLQSDIYTWFQLTGDITEEWDSLYNFATFYTWQNIYITWWTFTRSWFTFSVIPTH